MANLVYRKIKKVNLKKYKKLFEIYINKKFIQLLKMTTVKQVYKIIFKVNKRLKRIEIFFKKFRYSKRLATLKNQIKSKFGEFLLIAIIILKMLNLNFEDSEFSVYKYNFQKESHSKIELVQQVSSSFDQKRGYFINNSLNDSPMTLGDLEKGPSKDEILRAQRFLDSLVPPLYIDPLFEPETAQEWKIYESNWNYYLNENIKAVKRFEYETKLDKEKELRQAESEKRRRQNRLSFPERTTTLQNLSPIEESKAVEDSTTFEDRMEMIKAFEQEARLAKDQQKIKGLLERRVYNILDIWQIDIINEFEKFKKSPEYHMYQDYQEFLQNRNPDIACSSKKKPNSYKDPQTLKKLEREAKLKSQKLEQEFDIFLAEKEFNKKKFILNQEKLKDFKIIASKNSHPLTDYLNKSKLNFNSVLHLLNRINNSNLGK